MAEPASDNFRAARESDFRRLLREVTSLGHAQRTLAARVSSLESTAAVLRADVVAGYEVDQALSEAIDEMLADVATGR